MFRASATDRLASLIQSIDSRSREDPRRRDELLRECETILTSHAGPNKEADIGNIAASVKRQLLQTPGGSNSALRFSNLVSRLLEQPILSQKHSVLLFLQSLASNPPSTPTPAISPFLAELGAKPSSYRNREASYGTSIPQVPTSKSKTKAELLREYRAKIGKPHLPEHLLLRDTLYLIQGISGQYVRFSSSEGPAGSSNKRLIFIEDDEYIISPPTQTLVHKLSELGHLYSRVAAFVKEREGQPSVGLIEQSICHHLQAQLTEYYRLVAVLESQMTNGTTELNVESAVKEDSGLTLRRLDVWIDEWRLRMRMMSVCVENCKEAKGGALVSLIHSNTSNGDPFIRNFTDTLLEQVSKPFFKTLQRWLFTGDLHDPYHEFFVAVRADLAYTASTTSNGTGAAAGAGVSVDLLGTGDLGLGIGAGGGDTGVGGLELWEKKYAFRKRMLPSFLSEEFGKKIFSTGKSLNFIRYSCHDGNWVAARSKVMDTTLKYSDIAGLERSIDSAYRVASQRLFDVFFDKFRLMEHITAVKSYLLLGHGDFAESLVELLGPSLSRPANTLHRHHLTGMLETAKRNSCNVEKDSPEITRRLDARMMDYQHGEIGWDVFTLEYKVDAPVDTVLGPDSMEQYRRLFNHLWKMKRIESVLNTMWTKVTSGSHVRMTIPEFQGRWHQVHLTMAGMIHCVRQMQAYSHLEVIACRWKVFVDFTAKKEGDLDTLIGAHRSFLNDVLIKVLLLMPEKKGAPIENGDVDVKLLDEPADGINKEGTQAKTPRKIRILTKVREVFQSVLQFNAAVESFDDLTHEEEAYRDRARDGSRGVETGFAAFDSAAQRERFNDRLDATFEQLELNSKSFSEKMMEIVYLLENHPDQDCKFLAKRLSFSKFYEPPKRSRKSSRSGDREAKERRREKVAEDMGARG